MTPKDALDYLTSWTGEFVRVELIVEGIPTSFKARGELLNDADEPTDFKGWFVVVRTPEQRVPGVGSLELRLDRYEHHVTHEGKGAQPVTLAFSTPPRVMLLIEPVVEDPG